MMLHSSFLYTLQPATHQNKLLCISIIIIFIYLTPRLQLFVEEGEREMMNEQITVLQDKVSMFSLKLSSSLFLLFFVLI